MRWHVFARGSLTLFYRKGNRMSLPGGGELIIILAVLMMLFGASRLPKLARSMGQAGKEFKQGIKEGASRDGEGSVEGPCPFCGTEIAPEAKFCAGCGKNATDVISARVEKAPQSV